MSERVVVSSRRVHEALIAGGFTWLPSRSGHRSYRKDGVNVQLSYHTPGRDLSMGSVKLMAKQLGMTVGEFAAFVRGGGKT